MPDQPNTHHRPADGERWAVLGFSVQYLLAANLAYECLTDDSLEWLAVADPEAGKVDDFQVGTSHHVQAYQFKWHEHPPSLTFAELVGSDAHPELSLLHSLADGWLKISTANPDKEVIVNLVTNSPASVSDRPAHKLGTLPRHTSAFLSDVWRSPIDFHTTAPPQRWQAAYLLCKKATGLTGTQFEAFRRSCRVLVSQSLPEVLAAPSGYSHNARRTQDILDLARELQRTVAFDRSIVHLQKSALLSRMNWSSRWEFQAVHHFPVGSTYAPIKSTVEALEELLRNTNRGYICLLGTPGSGKSTLLTQTFRYRADIQTYRYYCYVPNSSGTRAEAFSFLHDITLALWKDGVRPSDTTLGTSIEEARTCFQKQLAYLNSTWLKRGRKSVILVDGLDHVERENSPQHSLLRELPAPEAIPEGVVIALGTQTLELPSISRTITAHLQAGNRSIQIDRLDRLGIQAVVEKTDLGVSLGERELGLLHRLSKGHPLALGYLLNRLRGCKSDSNIQELLAATPPYDERIEQQYQTFWLALNDSEEIRYQLALLCRLRIAFSPDDEHWPQSGVAELSKRAKHYFVSDSQGRWTFFHNSFRQFLLDRTGRSSFSQTPSAAENRKYHLELSALANRLPRPMASERLYHLYEANEIGEVLNCASQQFFRLQFLEGRSTSAIRDDIALAIDAAAQSHDRLALIRLILIDEEISERAEIRSNVELRHLLIELGEIDAAKIELNLDNLERDDAHTIKALDFSLTLYERGLHRDAQELFDAAEPLDLLKGVKEIGEFDGSLVEVLESWIPMAVRMRPLDSVISSILSLRFKNSNNPRRKQQLSDQKRSTRSVLRRLFWELTIALFNVNQQSKLTLVIDALKSSGDQALTRDIAWVAKLEGVRRSLGDPGSEKLISRAERQATRLGSLYWIWLDLAEHRLFHQQHLAAARAIAKRCDFEDSIHFDQAIRDGFLAFTPLIRVTRFYSALRQPIELSSVLARLPSHATEADRFLVSALWKIATVWGLAFCGKPLAPESIVYELRGAILLTETSGRRQDRPLDWHIFRGIRADFYDQIIYCAAAHSMDAASAVIAFIQERWESPENSRYWPNSIRRHIGVVDREVRNNDTLLRKTLEAADDPNHRHTDIQDHLNELSEKALYWQQLGQSAKSKELISKIMRSGSGIYHEKDTQLDEWLLWVPQLLQKGSTDSLRDASWLTYSIAYATAFNKGYRPRDTAFELLLQLSRHRPSLAALVRSQFVAMGSLKWADAATAFCTGTLVQTDVLSDINLPLLVRVCLAFLKQIPDALREILPEVAIQVAGQENGETLLAYLSSASDAECTGSDATILHSRIASATEPDVSHFFRPGGPDSTNRHSNEREQKLRLRSGEVVDGEELLKRTSSPESILSLCESADPKDYFNWQRLLGTSLESAPHEQQMKIATALTHHSGAFHAVLDIVDRIAVEDQNATLEPFLLKLASGGATYGWLQRYDGGTRLLPFQRLIAINQKYRNDALKQFARDYLGGSRSAREYVRSMHVFLELFWDTPPLDELWLEVRDHISQIADFQIPIPSEWPSFEVDSQSKDAVLHEFVLECLKIPAPELKTSTFVALADWMAFANDLSSLSRTVDALLAGGSEEIATALALIYKACQCNSAFAESFSTRIDTCLTHADMAIRLLAQRVASLGQARKPLAPLKRALALSYTIELPEFRIEDRVSEGGTLLPSGVLHETNDPLELTSILSSELRLLEKETGIARRNLVERCVTLMRQSTINWSAGSEALIQDHFRAIELDVSFRRPRAAAAFEAFGRMVAELYDAERIDEGLISFLQPLLSPIDLDLAGLAPVAMPSDSFMITKPEKDIWRSRSWLQELDNLQPIWPRYQNTGRRVIAFTSESSIPVWEHLQEEWSGSLRFERLRPSDADALLIHHTTHWIMASIYSNRYWKAAQLDHVAIQKAYSRTEVPQARWLAFNPAIADALRWKRHHQGVFEWANPDGEVVAGSCYWRHGRVSRHPYSDEAASSGWAVWVSEKGFDELTRRFGAAHSQQKVVRSLRDTESKTTSEVTRFFS